MHVDRSIRAMTPEEKQAKRDWGTGACQVRGCTTRAAYLVLETSSSESESGDWWQYCLPEARQALRGPARAGDARCGPQGFAQHGRAIRRAEVGQDSSPAAGVHAGQSGSWRTRADLEVCPTLPR